MKKLFIIDREQFGTLTDTYQYCKYLGESYKISYVCFDKGISKTDLPGINVHYVSYQGTKTMRGIHFFLSIIRYTLFWKGFIFIIYFPQCEWIKRMLFWKRMHLDIRTLSVKECKKDRIKENIAIKHACRYFNSVSIITKELGEKLQLSNQSFYILPLGADCISTVLCRDYQQMRLLYVGALFNRHIIETVIGVHRFISQHPEEVILYDIVGEGEELEDITGYIAQHHLESVIRVHGRIRYDQLKPFFDFSNIGVSFVPIKEYYQHQPVTKTFEYLMSGLFCIATDTIENRKVISSSNGVLIKSNCEAFVKALEDFRKKRDSLDFSMNRDESQKYNWKNIIQKNLLPILNV